MNTDQPLPHIKQDGKFLSRLRQKFFFKAMRLPEANGAIDFVGKVALLKRLEELKRGHTTGLVLTEAQAELVLDLAAQAGLYALVEIEVAPEELFGRASYRAMIARVSACARALQAYPALIGYLINCPIEADMLKSRGLDSVKRKLGGVLSALRRNDSRHLAGLK